MAKPQSQPDREGGERPARPSKRTPAPIRTAALRVVEHLQQAGHIAYFAGGCVRDRVMGIEPKDYDVATDARPERVRDLFHRTMAVGEHFGVILVHLMGRRIEVATFRAEAGYSDRRRPDAVRFTDARRDAMRRDFTINGMFENPIADEIIDYVGGQADVKSRIIRAIGDPDVRLAEDHLRALRAVRFSARFGFAIEPATRDAVRRHALELAGVSRERIGHELRFMFAEPTAANAAREMQDLGLDAPTLKEAHGDHPLPVLEALEAPAPFPAALAAWAIDRGRADDPEVVPRWRRALVLTNDESEAMRAILNGTRELESEWSTTMTVARQKRLAAHPQFSEMMRVLKAIDSRAWERVREDVARWRESPVGIAPEPLITGDDLVAMGLPPGPAYRRILDAVYDAQLEARLASRDEALEMARQLVAGDAPLP